MILSYSIIHGYIFTIGIWLLLISSIFSYSALSFRSLVLAVIPVLFSVCYFFSSQHKNRIVRISLIIIPLLSLRFVNNLLGALGWKADIPLFVWGLIFFLFLLSLPGFKIKKNITSISALDISIFITTIFIIFFYTISSMGVKENNGGSPRSASGKTGREGKA